MLRDIKPDNVLVNTQGFVKLTDFGITKQLDETIAGGWAGTFCGTLFYLSPERMENEKYSYEGDIWSIGILLIELMTGHYPYQKHKGILEMLEQIKYDPSPNLPETYFSADLRDFLSRCLKKKPHERDSAIALLSHPWILNCTQQEANLPTYLQQLKRYK